MATYGRPASGVELYARNATEPTNNHSLTPRAVTFGSFDPGREFARQEAARQANMHGERRWRSLLQPAPAPAPSGCALH